MSWMQESDKSRAAREEQQKMQVVEAQRRQDIWLIKLDIAAETVYQKWETLEIDRILLDIVRAQYGDNLSFTIFSFRSKLDARKLFPVAVKETEIMFSMADDEGDEVYEDHYLGLSDGYGEIWSDDLIEVLNIEIVDRGGHRPEDVEFIGVGRRIEGFHLPVSVPGSSPKREFSIGMDKKEITIDDKDHWPLQEIEATAKELGVKPVRVIEQRLDAYIAHLYQDHGLEEQSRSQSPAAQSSPTEFRHLTDSEIYGFVQENGQFQRMMEDRRIQAEMHRRMREDEEMRDRIRYELERRAAEDPNFRWPSGIPRGDAYGEIISRRRLDERSWGVPSRSEHDDYYRDDERLRGDIGFYYGGDHASGADKG